MSTIHMNAPQEVCASMDARRGAVDRFLRRVATELRERRRRRALKELLALHDGILDDLGVSRNELSLASRPRLPTDVLAWLGRAR